MTILIITLENNPQKKILRSMDPKQIAGELAKRNVKFEQWTANVNIPSRANSEDVINAYAMDVDRIKKLGYDTIDVLRVVPDHNDPDWPEKAKEVRQKFLKEHTHSDDEVRFFVEGRGCFYLRINGEVLMLIVEAGDLVWVPAGTTHWFDMGQDPEMTVIRFFRIPEGWVADYTGDNIAKNFPTIDELTAG